MVVLITTTKPAMKAQYRIRNWSEYNAGLKQRGSLSFWIEASVLEHWILPNLSGKPGASQLYSDLAIETMAMVKAIYRLAGRQCQGFLESVFELMNLDLPVPDSSTLSRRVGKLSIALPVVPVEGARHVVVDSTGVKVYGEGECAGGSLLRPLRGEWKTRIHGISKRRTWRKLHLGVDEATGEILAAVVSTNDVSDGQVLPTILDTIEDDIQQVTADGAYDQRQCYHSIRERQAKAVIPPRQGAKLTPQGNTKAQHHDRDENLRRIHTVGRQVWKQETHYHRRSLAETTMFRFKTIFGGNLSARTFDNQAAELLIKCALLNYMIQIAKPDSYKLPA